eukprot:TRINITY_DN4380_c0_g2_i1.p1 TRINITY_DN4380_c0_g2~~TRINITY_DN4380_c0_g2_i1.p1  ORF type:complete len:208 (-),score=86.01 TRINITY_DN4380_c0_g2_i1:5-628(-)
MQASIKKVVDKLFASSPDPTSITLRQVKEHIASELELEQDDVKTHADYIKQLSLDHVEKAQSKPSAASSSSSPSSSISSSSSSSPSAAAAKVKTTSSTPTINNKQLKQKRQRGDDDDGDEDQSSSSSSGRKIQKDDDGNTYFTLDDKDMTRVTISSFKGVEYVNIRKYYADKASGAMKPTTKGIALNANEWASLKRLIGDIDEARSE